MLEALSGFQMANKNFLSREYPQSLGKKSRAATRHEVDHKKAMKLYERGLTDLNIAGLLGVSKGDVFRWRKEHGLTSNMIRQREGSIPSRKKKSPPKK